MMKSVVSLFFNIEYSKIVLYKLTGYRIKEKNLHIDYTGLGYLEYKDLCNKFKLHECYLGHYRYKKGIDFHTVFIFKISTNKMRLVYAVENRYEHLLSTTVKNHICSFTHQNVFTKASTKKDSIMMIDEITLKVKEELFEETQLEEQFQCVENATLLQDIDCFE